MGSYCDQTIVYTQPIDNFFQHKQKQLNNVPDSQRTMGHTLPTLNSRKNKKTQNNESVKFNKVKQNQQHRRSGVGIEQLSAKANQDFQNRQRIRQQNQRKERLEREAKIKKQKQENEARIRQQKQEEDRKEKERLKKIQQEKAIQKQKKTIQKKQQQLSIQKEEKKERQQEDLQRQRQIQLQKAEKQNNDAQQKVKQEKKNQQNKRNMQLSRFKVVQPSIFLDQLVDYADSIKEGKQIKCAVNSIGDIKKVTKDMIIWTDSFINKININDPEQINTFIVKVWNVIVNQLIMKAKKDGYQITPPTRLEAEIYKNCINTYILMINLLRLKGMQKFWLCMVGKTLSLLDFIYKRKQILKDFKSLDLAQKRYIKKFGDNFQNIYFSRLDQLSYLLFGLLLMNPYDSFVEIGIKNGDMTPQIQNMIQQFNRPWDYSIFWLLISQVQSISFKYFKPVIYTNVLALLNTQLIKTKQSKQNVEFLKIFEALVAELVAFPKLLAKDPEIKLIKSWNIDGYIDGEQFIDTLAPIKALGSEKKKIFESNNIEDIRNKGSVLYYFKSYEN